MNQKQPSISIVIPNYNGSDLILKTIESAYNALKTSGVLDFEVIVSDDASTDDSVTRISTSYSEVIVVTHPFNTGFSGSANRGMNKAKKEIICLLNSDVHLGEGYFEKQLPLFQEAKTFGVMGLIKEQGTNLFQDGAKLPALNSFRIDSNKNDFSYESVSPTLFLSGANALVCRKKLKQLGGFNELFNPYYSEDVDLGIRAWRMGWELYFQPESVCYHAQSSTIKKLPNEHVRMIAKRNKHFLHFLHLPRGFHWFYVIRVTFNAALQSMAGKQIYVKALKMFYQNIPVLISQRRKLNESSRMSGVSNLIGIRKNIKALMEKRGTRGNPS